MNKENMSRRIEFLKNTRLLLAKRAGYKCSFRDCVIDTDGPAVTLVGEQGGGGIAVAAHIFAAAEHGPRPGGSLTPEELADVSNGLWMCSNHGRQIDTFESDNPAHALMEMKKVREFAQHLTISNPHVSYFVPWMGGRRLDAIVRAHLPDLDREKIIGEVMAEGVRCMPIGNGATMPLPSEKLALAVLSEIVREVVSSFSTGSVPPTNYANSVQRELDIKNSATESTDGHSLSKEITHIVLMAALGRWYFSRHKKELFRRSQGPQTTATGELSFAIVVDPASGMCHFEVFFSKKNFASWAAKPQLRDFFHRAWTRLGVPDILDFKTPAYCLLPDDMEDDMHTLDEFGKQMRIKVLHGQYHVEHCTKDEIAAAIMQVLEESISRADSDYERSIEEEFYSPVWNWHSENSVLLGALVSEIFPNIWHVRKKYLKFFDFENIQPVQKKELNNPWLINGLQAWGAAHWSQTEYYPYNWDNSPQWSPLGLGVNTEPEDFYGQAEYRFE